MVTESSQAMSEQQFIRHRSIGEVDLISYFPYTNSDTSAEQRRSNMLILEQWNVNAKRRVLIFRSA